MQKMITTEEAANGIQRFLWETLIFQLLTVEVLGALEERTSSVQALVGGQGKGWESASGEIRVVNIYQPVWKCFIILRMKLDGDSRISYLRLSSVLCTIFHINGQDNISLHSVQFTSVQLPSCVQFFVTP